MGERRFYEKAQFSGTSRSAVNRPFERRLLRLSSQVTWSFSNQLSHTFLDFRPPSQLPQKRGTGPEAFDRRSV
jgi:hypothetical protein